MFARSATPSTIASRSRAGATALGYVPRRTTATVLPTIVRDPFETYCDCARQSYARGLPRYGKQALHNDLACGVFARGFLRLHGDDCRRDLLVAFIYQGRGLRLALIGRSRFGTAARRWARGGHDLPLPIPG
jgi:hypothetical protein